LQGFPIANDPLYGNGKKVQKADKQACQDTMNFDPDCAECVQPHLDPDEEQLCLWLHAMSYSSKDWKFEAPLPSWVGDTIVEDKQPQNNNAV
jgi:hypothetical protein